MTTIIAHTRHALISLFLAKQKADETAQAVGQLLADARNSLIGRTLRVTAYQAHDWDCVSLDRFFTKDPQLGELAREARVAEGQSWPDRLVLRASPDMDWFIDIKDIASIEEVT